MCIRRHARRGEAKPLEIRAYNEAMKDAAELLKEALSLPAEARGVLIDALLESLDVEVDENSEEIWREEIHRRLQEIDSGAVDLIPWDVAERRLASRLRR
jgi:putative addiction module component (TIGR02574 family)